MLSRLAWINKVDLISYLSLSHLMGKVLIDFQIDLFHNGGKLKHSFICMIISISDLVSMCKIQKNSLFQETFLSRPERLIYDI